MLGAVAHRAGVGARGQSAVAAVDAVVEHDLAHVLQAVVAVQALLLVEADLAVVHHGLKLLARQEDHLVEGMGQAVVALHVRVAVLGARTLLVAVEVRVAVLEVVVVAVAMAVRDL